MISRPLLRTVAAHNHYPHGSNHCGVVGSNHTFRRDSLKPFDPVGERCESCGQVLGTSIKQDGTQHQHPSGRHKIKQATVTTSWRTSLPTMALTHLRVEPRSVRGGAYRVCTGRNGPNNTGKYLAGRARGFATTVHYRAFVPKKMPSGIPLKARVEGHRDTQIQMALKAEEGRLREQKETKERLIRDQIEAEQRLLQEQKDAENKRLLAHETRRQVAEEHFQQQLDTMLQSMTALESQMACFGWRCGSSVASFLEQLLKDTRFSARLHLCWQRREQLENNIEDVALKALRNIDRLGIQAEINSLAGLLTTLDKYRHHQWTLRLQDILEQKTMDGAHGRFRQVTQDAEDGLRSIVDAIDQTIMARYPWLPKSGFFNKVLRQKDLSKAIAGLVFCRQPLKETFLSRYAHSLRSWNRVALRQKLAPIIFSDEVRSAVLETKVFDLQETANSIHSLVRVMRWELGFPRYDLFGERLMVLANLLKSRAHDVKDIGLEISGFRLLPSNAACPMQHPQYEDILEIELCRVCYPITSLVSEVGRLLELVSMIIDDNTGLYSFHGIHDPKASIRQPLVRMRAFLSSTVRHLYNSKAEILYWRGLQFHYQSQWGKRLPPSSLSHLSTALADPPNPSIAPSSREAHIADFHSARIPQTAGPSIFYVTTWEFAHTALESFRSSFMVGFDILSFPSLDQGPASGHRSQLQALVLATDNHIAIFHFALFETWDPELKHIPALKEILESKHTLKVGVNMNSHAQLLACHTTIDMNHFADLEYMKDDRAMQNALTIQERSQYDILTALAARYFDTTLPGLKDPQDITHFGLVRASYIQYLASRAYAASKLHVLLEQTNQTGRSAVIDSMKPQNHDELSVLGRFPGIITIDPVWEERRSNLFATSQSGELHIRSKIFSRLARSRDMCLSRIVEDITTAIMAKKGYLDARTRRERMQNKAKIDGIRQDLKAMYLRVFFDERTTTLLGIRAANYDTHRVLQIANLHKIEIPPVRRRQLELECGTEILEAPKQASLWLERILISGSYDVLMQSPAAIQSARSQLLQDYGRDVLQLFAIWQVTSISYTDIASLYSITVPQVKSDILMVTGLQLLRPVKHKLDRLLQDFSSPQDGPISQTAPSFVSEASVLIKPVKPVHTIAEGMSGSQKPSKPAMIFTPRRSAGDTVGLAPTDSFRVGETAGRKLTRAESSTLKGPIMAKMLKRTRRRLSGTPDQGPTSEFANPFFPAQGLPDPLSSKLFRSLPINTTRGPNKAHRDLAKRFARASDNEKRRSLMQFRNRARVREQEAASGVSPADSPLAQNIFDHMAMEAGKTVRECYDALNESIHKPAVRRELPPPTDIKLKTNEISVVRSDLTARRVRGRLRQLRNRARLREKEIADGISLADSAVPLNHGDRKALFLGQSPREYWEKEKKIVCERAVRQGILPPDDITLDSDEESISDSTR